MKFCFHDDHDLKVGGSTPTQTSLLCPWIRRFMITISAWWNLTSSKLKKSEAKINRKTRKQRQLQRESGFVLCIAHLSLSRDRRINYINNGRIRAEEIQFHLILVQLIIELVVRHFCRSTKPQDEHFYPCSPLRKILDRPLTTMINLRNEQITVTDTVERLLIKHCNRGGIQIFCQAFLLQKLYFQPVLF